MGAGQKWSDKDDFLQTGLVPLTPELKQGLKDFRDWIWTDADGDPSYGNVELWATIRQWRSQGSLERHVARELRRQNIEYAGLPKAEKLRRLHSAFEKRNQQVARIRKAFFHSDDSISLIAAEFRNASQFVRSQSVITGADPDTSVPLRIIERGLERFPGSHILRFWRAEYLRYVWDIPSAIAEFRDLRMTATDGDLRRQASIELARCLHASLVYDDEADEVVRVNWANEAKDVLEQLSGAFREAEEIAILKDHVALEAGDHVDWSSLETMYRNIVGQVEGFPSSLIRNYDFFQINENGAPENVAETLHRNFADPEVLGAAGSLYLRRAERAIPSPNLHDFERAVAFLRAQAVIERSWSGREYPVTSFRIGRVILSSARHLGKLNPIEGLSRENRPDQLALAEAKFNGAASRSTGAFRLMARRLQSEACKLRQILR